MRKSETNLSSTALLGELADGVGGEIGTVFLERVVNALRQAMDAHLVLITVGDGLPASRAEATYALRNGLADSDVAYSLAGTPCECVYRGETFTVPSALAKRFPREKGWEGYIGVPIRDRNQIVVGNFAVFSEAPINKPDLATQIVKIFGARIEAEMQYRALIEERDFLIENLQSANESIEVRNKALHAANQFKTSILGMVAHDLRNPLAAIIAKAELLQARIHNKSLDPKKADTDLEKITNNAERLSEIISSTLLRCRTDSASLQLYRNKTDVERLVRQAIESNAEGARQKVIDIALTSAGDCTASLDESLCLEAIDNLISNAIKYSFSGANVRVNIESDSEFVVVAVRDQGQGMTEDDLKRAFGAFQVLSAKPTGGESSTGLGLCNVRQIARAHGGEVTAKSEGPGKGSVFSLRLPKSDLVTLNTESQSLQG